MASPIASEGPRFKFGLAAAVAAGAALTAEGCVYLRPQGAPRAPAAVDLGVFDYLPAAAPPRVEAESAEGVPSARRVVFAAAPGASFEAMTAHAWEPAGEGRRSSALIFPILGGDYGLQELLARWLVRAGYRTLWFERPRPPLEPPGDFSAVRAYLVDVVRESRRALDWWEREPGVDPERVALLGTSMGSVVGTLLLAAEPRFAAGALLLAGGDIPKVLAEADEEEIVAFRAALAERGVLGDAVREEARRALAEADPLRYAAAVDPAKALLVSGRLDDVVPFESATALWEAMGRPDRLVFWGGHYSAVLYLRDIQRATLAHFARRMGNPGPKM